MISAKHSERPSVAPRMFAMAAISLAVQAAFAAPGPALTVDAAAAQHAISPYIYGMNYAGEALAKELRLPVRRLGGNSTTRYNWKIDVSNRGSDWYYENIPEEIMNGGVSDPKNLPDASSANRFIEQDRRTGTKTLLTMPMTGWVAKRRTPNNNHPFDCGFKVSQYGGQQSTDTYDTDCGNGKRTDGSNVSGNKPEDTSLAVGPAFVQEWLRYLTQRYGTADAGGVRFVNLDNEPELWRHTHRDVRPQALSYDELRDRTLQYAAAIKAVDKSVQTLGPAGWGWHAYFYSDKDTLTANFWDNPLDRNAHGGVPLAEWYLQQLSAYEKANGVRLLDYLDEHYYPQASGVLDNQTDAATNALRLRQTRVLWDASYVDESWINQPVRLIPRMREWVTKNYPGTKLAMSEYNFGALNHINGALAQADILGIFGREALDLATLWAPPAANDPGAYAFRMYRNYDGAGSAFGETSVSARSADQGKLAVYAARQTTGGALTLMVINKTDQELSSPLTVANFSPAAAGKTYRYSNANLAAIVRASDVVVSNRSFTANYPANSITLVSLPAAAPAPAPDVSCTVTYGANSQWATGFVASVTVKNSGAQAINGWTLIWQFTGDQKISSIWNASFTQSGGAVTAQNAGWNSAIAAGGSVNFGFNANYSGTNTAPSAFTLNGKACK